MSEYEVLELISTYREEGGFHVMNFAAAMFGYVAAAYFVGKSLTRFQTISITILYSLFVPGPMAACYEATVSMRTLSSTYADQYATAVSASGLDNFAPIIVPGTIIIGWIISIVFMYQVRKA